MRVDKYVFGNGSMGGIAKLLVSLKSNAQRRGIVRSAKVSDQLYKHGVLFPTTSFGRDMIREE